MKPQTPNWLVEFARGLLVSTPKPAKSHDVPAPRSLPSAPTIETRVVEVQRDRSQLGSTHLKAEAARATDSNLFAYAAQLRAAAELRQMEEPRTERIVREFVRERGRSR